VQPSSLFAPLISPSRKTVKRSLQRIEREQLLKVKALSRFIAGADHSLFSAWDEIAGTVTTLIRAARKDTTVPEANFDEALKILSGPANRDLLARISQEIEQEALDSEEGDDFTLHLWLHFLGPVHEISWPALQRLHRLLSTQYLLSKLLMDYRKYEGSISVTLRLVRLKGTSTG